MTDRLDKLIEMVNGQAADLWMRDRKLMDACTVLNEDIPARLALWTLIDDVVAEAEKGETEDLASEKPHSSLSEGA